MLYRVIRETLREKVENWLESLPEGVRNSVRNDIVVTGGCIVSLLDNESPNDYDIYLRSPESVLVLMKHYCPQLQIDDVERKNIKEEYERRLSFFIPSSGIYKAEPTKTKFHVKVVTDNAITLSDRIQIIIRFWGEPDEIHRNFDFDHCTNYYLMAENTLVLRPEAMVSYATKELKYNGSLYPVTSLFRIRKFVERGWKISAGEMLKMIYQLQFVDLRDIAVLKEQLIGVDTYYTSALITALKAQTGDIDACAMAQIVNEVYK